MSDFGKIGQGKRLALKSSRLDRIMPWVWAGWGRSDRRFPVSIARTGLAYCGIMLFLGLAAITNKANLLFGMFGLMFGVLLVSIFLCRLVLWGVQVERVLPDHVVVGTMATVQYRFFNSKRFWASLSVGLTELDGREAFARTPHAYLLHCAPRMTATTPVDLIPKRRGLHRLNEYQLVTSFPFGFIERAVSGRKSQSVLVYPAIGKVSPRLLELCESAERGGADQRPRAGGQDEFFGVKQFRAGDNPRWIHWKRSARTGELVLREMAQISPPRLVILIDTFARDGDSASVERALAMGASLASGAFDLGLAVGLVVSNADGSWTSIGPRRGKRHGQDILAALAAARVDGKDRPEMIERGAEAARDGATVVLFTPRAVGTREADRGGMVMVSSTTTEGRAMVEFDAAVDFSQCGPAPAVPGGAR